MLSTTRKEGADRETDPRRYSLEREPWRFMRPSLAVQFDLRKHSRRERPDLEVEIAAGLESRFAIKRLYFKVHSALWDLLESAAGDRRAMLLGVDLLEAARYLAGSDPLSAHRSAILNVVDALEEHQLLVQGFVRVVEERSGEVHFWFELASRRRCMSAEALLAEERRFGQAAETALDRLRSIANVLNGQPRMPA